MKHAIIGIIFIVTVASAAFENDFWSHGKLEITEKSAYDYGFFLGKRYEKYPNIIWITGGDQPAFTVVGDWRPFWHAMINGIREGTKGKAMITYHPWGESSSTDFWKEDDILDFNRLQSGHKSHDIPAWKWIWRDYNLSPAKPVLNGEPNYEDHPVNWNTQNGYFRDYDVRKQLYRSVFAGACGVTYGHQAVRQFYSPGIEPAGFQDRYWTEALDRPGAFQAGFLKDLILSRPPLNRVSDQSMIPGSQNKESEFMTAFRDAEGSYGMVYMPVEKTLKSIPTGQEQKK